jgi:DDE superfamily endonuclease/Homeodomain-like domain
MFGTTGQSLPLQDTSVVSSLHPEAMTYTSPTKKAQIVLLRTQHVSEKEIAEKYSVDRTTVNQIFKRYKESKDFYHIKKESGCPCKFTTHEVCITARMLASTRAAHDVADLQRQHLPNLHADMIQKRLTKCGLKAYIHHTKPFLSNVHKKQQLEWAESHAHWTVADWKPVIFSDESKFNLFGSDNCHWCWRKPGEEFDEKYVRKEVKHGGGNVMVWGCVTAIGMGWIVKIDGNMNGLLYTEILKDDILGTLKDLSIKKKDIYFQQDNNPKHTSKVAQEWFKKNKLDVLDWAPSSPDMNIIEHVSEYLDRRMQT